VRTILALLTTSLLAASCGEDPRTQVTFVLAADTAVTSGATSVDAKFFDANGVMIAESTSTSLTWPLTFAVVRSHQDEFIAEFTARSGSSTVARATAHVEFASGKTSLYYIDLVPPKSPCAALACQPGFECTTSTNPASCIAVPTVDASTLPRAPAGDAAKTSPCVGVACDGGEACSVVYGVPTCGCTFPHTGAGCAACAPGWTLMGSACVPGCQSSCGVHAICNSDYDVPVCECARGYVDSGAGCAWVGGGANGGGNRDPELADTNAWTQRLVTFNGTLFGPTDGAATFAAFGACGGSLLAQTFDMPDRAVAEPFMLEITVRSNDTGFTGDTLVRARVGESLLPFAYTAGATRVGTACLGANAYGRGIDLGIVADANGNPSQCIQGSGGNVKPPVTIDRVRIVPASAATCPAPGIRDGGFGAGGTPDWTFTASLNGQAGSASGASGAAVLSTTQHCQSVSVRQDNVSFPTAAELPNPALKFDINATTGIPVEILLGGGATEESNYPDYLGSFIGKGANVNATICIPPSIQGTTRTLSFFLDNLSGLCSNAIARNATIDNVAIVSDAACAGATTTFDSGFEFGAGGAGFHLRTPIDDTPATAPFYGPLMVGASAHSGTNVYRVDGGGTVGNVPIYANLDLPRDVNTATGPEVHFFYWTSTGATSPSVRVGDVAPPMFGGTTTWTEHTICLDADLEGQRISVPFVFAQGSAGATLHYIDDVSVTLSTNCP